MAVMTQFHCPPFSPPSVVGCQGDASSLSSIPEPNHQKLTKVNLCPVQTNAKCSHQTLQQHFTAPPQPRIVTYSFAFFPFLPIPTLFILSSCCINSFKFTSHIAFLHHKSYSSERQKWHMQTTPMQIHAKVSCIVIVLSS